MPKFKDYTNKKINNLYIIERAESKRQKCGKLVTYWLCECICGKKVIIRQDCIKNNNGCGCLNNKNKYKCNRLYAVWRHMNERCYDINDPNYKNYGGRGTNELY